MLTKRVRALSRSLRRDVTSDAADVAGLGCLVGAAWWWQPIVGLVALGLAFLLVGWGLDR